MISESYIKKNKIKSDEIAKAIEVWLNESPDNKIYQAAIGESGDKKNGLRFALSNKPGKQAKVNDSGDCEQGDLGD
jgi:hypothetical protein